MPTGELNAADAQALRALPSIPRDTEGPVFSEPWQAEVFAMTLTLYEQGLFTWAEWAAILSDSISKAQDAGDPDRGDSYYLHWLDALERMVVERQLGSPAALGQWRARWEEAARSTPHGRPIVPAGESGE
jgi:nitrile hydratase accessory protein